MPDRQRHHPDTPSGPTGARQRSRAAIALAGLGLLFCWVPWAGVVVSAASLLASIRLRRRGARVGWAVAVGVWGLLLGLFFSWIVAVHPPHETTRTDEEIWDDFARAFEDHGGSDGPANRAPPPAADEAAGGHGG